MLKSLFSAFLMYSKIPMPKVEWSEENRRYSLGFFPFVGVVSGLILILWKIICDMFDMGSFIFSAIAVSIPVIITGGIHLDGFCDVSDAKSSYADREKKLKIMSDPHIGSFAVINLIIYLILQTAFFSQLYSVKSVILVSLSFVISRALSGISAITFKSAKNNGTLQSFVKPSHKKTTILMELIFLFLSFLISIFINAVEGIIIFAVALGVFLYYRKFAYKHFGGVTGDLCGWFLQICEIAILMSVVLSEKVMEVLK